VKKLFKP